MCENATNVQEWAGGAVVPSTASGRHVAAAVEERSSKVSAGRLLTVRNPFPQLRRPTGSSWIWRCQSSKLCSATATLQGERTTEPERNPSLFTSPRCVPSSLLERLRTTRAVSHYGRTLASHHRGPCVPQCMTVPAFSWCDNYRHL